ncbi:hypothetical protein TNCT_293411 [Trichonephila clavata]|uniref:Uncharacterized protein n=1 Tax=Trichonephila clavata TaxID=2740835 RepID=A0A8X6KW08_TRICU|nr:hypothetical protein TNCT_293411 [Trichonephila clavata]
MRLYSFSSIRGFVHVLQSGFYCLLVHEELRPRAANKVKPLWRTIKNQARGVSDGTDNSTSPSINKKDKLKFRARLCVNFHRPRATYIDHGTTTIF